jgi:peptidoglycan/xylan/chitin deacetylase (PgdA/CDA1 family)
MSLVFYTHGSRDEAKVALTFDDGPNPPRTDEVLEILARAGVRATFFVIGKWVTAFPQAFERIVRAGHVVGNHSYEHHYHVSDYDKAEVTIANITGKRLIFGRAHAFDYGALNQSLFGRLPTTRIVDADVNPADYAQADPARIIRGVLEHEALGNGSIVDLHDGSELEDIALRLSRPLPMLEALPAIIDGLRARGLTPVGLDEMTLVDPLEWNESLPDRMVYSPTPRGVVKH